MPSRKVNVPESAIKRCFGTVGVKRSGPMTYEQQENGTSGQMTGNSSHNAPADTRNIIPQVSISKPLLPWDGVKTGRDGLLRRIENVLGSIS